MPHLCYHMKRLNKDDMVEQKKKGGNLVTSDFHKFCCDHPIQDPVPKVTQRKSLQKNKTLNFFCSLRLIQCKTYSYRKKDTLDIIKEKTQLRHGKIE